MTIKLERISKSFMVSGRSRRPLYRELINLGSRRLDGRLCCFLEPGAGAASALTSFPSSSQIVLHASHDHELMRRTCPLAIFIDGGAIRYFGTTQEVLDLYHREPGNE